MNSTMPRGKSRAWPLGLIAPILALGGTGCGAEVGSDGGEPVSAEVGAFSEPNCMRASANYTNVSGNIALPFSDVSPQTYTNARCGDALVYSLRDPGLTIVGSSLGSVSVYYDESGPTNQGDCELTENDVVVYTDKGTGGGTWYPLDGVIQMQGYWSNNTCYHPPAIQAIPNHTLTPLHPAWNYKVFATARHADGTTARMVVQSGDCGQIGQLACANAICDAGTAQGGSPGGNTMCEAVDQRTLTCSSLSAGSVTATETIILSNDGTWAFTGHAHDSGAFGMDYTLGMAAPNAYNGFQLGVVHSGQVHGTFDVGSRNSDFTDRGADFRVSRYWDAIKADADSVGWNCNLHTSTNGWLVAEDALIGLGVAAAGLAATLFLADPQTKCSDPTVSRDPNGTGVQVIIPCENPSY